MRVRIVSMPKSSIPTFANGNFINQFAHAFGGSLFDNPFGEANTFDFGGDLRARRNKIMKENDLTEDQANSMIFRMLSKEDRGRAIKERVFGTWTPAYNSNMEIVVPTATTSNRGNENRGISQSTGNSKTTSQKSATKPKAASSVTFNTNGTNKYDRYLNGSDGFSTPWGFKVDSKGKATDYTPEYIAAANKLTVADINRYADEHPNDPSLQSFIRNNGGTREKAFAKLTDDYVRKGAQDGNYGFLHHVLDQTGKENAATRSLTDEEFAAEYPMIARPTDGTAPVDWTDGSLWNTVKEPEEPALTKSPFKPKQTWTRYAPMVMSGLMGLKEMLTPADYANADAIMAAAYQAGAPVSVGTEYIGDYRKRDPFDERYLMNIINQRGAAANRNFMNLSGGNRAVAMSGILANDLTTQMALAEAARQAYLANRADDAQVAEFNRGTNQFNATAQNTRNLSLAQLNSGRQNAMLSGIAQGARLRQAIKDQRDAAISANLTNFAQGLGDLGKENGYYNMLGGLNEEGVLKYFYGDDWKTKFNNVNG